MLALFLRQRLNELLQEVGSVETLLIDTTEHTIQVSLQLEGESDSLRCDVKSYKILAEGEKRYLLLGETTASKQWIEILVRKFLVGKRINLPAEYGELVERLLG